MPEFLADDQPGLVVQFFLFWTQGRAVRPSGSRALPARQFLVALLRIGMAKPVHTGQACP